MTYFKLLEIALRTGRVTRKYPKEESLVTEDFRGAIEIDPIRCWGCGACVLACPPNALTIDSAGKTLSVEYFVGRCIFCGRCADVCPRDAVIITREFELASDDINDLKPGISLKTATCSNCGKPIGAENAVEAISEIIPAFKKRLHLCPDCRSKLFSDVMAGTHPRRA